MSLVALFQTDDPAHFTAPTGLATLARYPTAVLHTEMATVSLTADRRWVDRAPTSLAEDLVAEGPEVWLYLNPWWVWLAEELSGPAEWLRMAQHDMARETKAWIKDRSGQPLVVYNGHMRAIDARNFDYVDALAAELLKLPIKRFYLDAGFFHQEGYHGAYGGANEKRAAGMRRLYRTLRNGGGQVIANAGWEMSDPTVRPWVFPFAGDVDGVSIEPPTGFKVNGKWWPLVDSYGAAAPDIQRMSEVVKVWREMGKRVWLVARWQRSKPGYNYSPFATFAEHARFWTEAAVRLGCEASVHWNVQQAPWGDWAEKAMDGDRPQTVMDRIADLDRRMLAVEAAVRAMA